MFNIAPFITKYVRSLHAKDDRISIPYSKTQFGVVLMADVVGFSKLTTFANERGDSSPEAIASEIGDYMGECIKIIEFYGGDVVKFLGDAVLVCFQDMPDGNRRSSADTAISDDDRVEMSDRRKHVLLRQAMECGLQLLARQSHFRVYLTAEEIARHRAPDGSIERRHDPSNKKDSATSVLASSLYDEHGDDNHPREMMQPAPPPVPLSSVSSPSNAKRTIPPPANILPITLDKTDEKQPALPSSPLSLRHPSLQPVIIAPDDSADLPPESRKSSMGQNFLDTLNPFKRRPSSESLWNKFAVTDKRRGSSISSSGRTDDSFVATKNITSIDLELHIALSCGNVTNIIIGDMDPSEELANIPLIYPQSTTADTSPTNPTPHPETPGNTNANNVDENYFLRYHGRLEYAIGGEAVDSLAAALNSSRAGEICLTPAAFECIHQQQQTANIPYDIRDGNYVIKGFDWMEKKNGKSKKSTPLAHSQDAYLMERPLLLNQASQLKIEPLIPRIRDTSQLTLNDETSLQYFKYLNRSSLYRLQQGKGTFPAQVRDVTIMFVSLGKIDVQTPDGLQLAQNALADVIDVSVINEGILQQFAIDDKGATVLCVYGLPPMSHENEPVFAAKAAVQLRDSYRQKFPDMNFSISLSSGSIFNAVMPQDSPYRRDAAISGDAIVVAVRMLKFPFANHNIVCDLNTKKQIGWRCEFQGFGNHSVKGKKAPMPIYGLKNFGTSKAKQISLTGSTTSQEFFGYKVEMDDALQFVRDWDRQPNSHLIVVMGSSGSGKSLFCHTLQSRCPSPARNKVCWTVSTEVEKSTKYYMTKNLVLTLLEIMDSDLIPPINPLSEAETSTDDVSDQSFAATMLASHQRLSTLLMSQDLERDNKLELPMDRAADRPPTPPMDDCPSHPSQESHESLQEKGPASIHHSVSSTPSNTPLFHSKDVNLKLLQQVRRCLVKFNEREALLPLFRDLNIGLNDLEENKYTRNLDSRGRDILLNGLILRMVDHVSHYVNLIFVCDDMQWADQASIRLLFLVHEECPRVLMVFASRLPADYDLSFIDDFYRVGSHAEIALNGLDSLDIADIIIRSFGPGVTHVDPSIIKVVQERTKGNPLYVTNLAVVMKDFQQVTVEDGELRPTGNQLELENFLGEVDYRRIVMMQYDRLNANYQEFLTVASCLDQYFTIYEVGAAIQPSNSIFQHSDLQLVQKLIRRYDVYKFLQYSVDGSGTATPSNEQEQSHGLTVIIPSSLSSLSNLHNLNDTSPTSSDDAAEYSFLHDTIPKAIYETVSFERRINLHRQLANYYERNLTSDNQAQILGKVTRHYLQTDNRCKQVYYLEELANLNMRSYLLLEATEQLKKILTILDENDDLASGFSRLHYSDIYYRLGVCYTMRTDPEQGEKYLTIALDYLDQDIPRGSDSLVTARIWVNTFKQYKHRFWPKLLSHLTERKYKPEICTRIIDIMRQLSNIYMYTGNMTLFTYTSLVGVNTCESLGNIGPTYTLFLARYALVCWLHEKRKHSIYYLSRALTCISNNYDADTLTVCALLCFAAGKFKDTRVVTYQAIKGATTFGVVTDFQAFYRAVGILITTWIFEGTLDSQAQDRQLLKTMYRAARSNKDDDAIAWVRVYHVSNALITNRLDMCTDIVKHFQSDLQDNFNYKVVAISGLLFCYYTRLRRYDQARTYFDIFLSSLGTISLSASIYPTYGLIFATMALYELLEDKDNTIVSINGRGTSDQFTSDMAKLNNVFQRVKIWEFTEPSLYLARAFPYIATGRIVEGYMVLRHGTIEMKFIHEIRFLKAYYCSILGKYAFSPKDRIEWTEIAKTEFERINIASAVYCNPDPQNLYNLCTPADCINVSTRSDDTV
ncbi:hypothetical protein DM01DRAFT_1409225 [Hesseltinella vesiculosa]|uniref:Guanylate cyclase domain-containing protein n=1 Tax=Hesseltinella vesiculosa TaxID=101127 RepID=A0A1X2GC13_9FUNG|nr:hypothetical protein DM01DRAFT_1409225 [Hesseltinella vesiculosa]